MNVFSPRWFVATVEVSTTTSIAVTQHGRLVGGTSDSRLRDTLVGGLVGVTDKSRSIQLQGGVGWIASTPTFNDVPLQGFHHIAFGTTFNAGVPIAKRMDVVGTISYWFAPRGLEPFQGVGSQIVRAGAGVRIRVGDSRREP